MFDATKIIKNLTQRSDRISSLLVAKALLPVSIVDFINVKYLNQLWIYLMLKKCAD